MKYSVEYEKYGKKQYLKSKYIIIIYSFCPSVNGKLAKSAPLYEKTAAERVPRRNKCSVRRRGKENTFP